jgi:putative toxin-antitoxin system antitoxin component (TIGR02293 family)
MHQDRIKQLALDLFDGDEESATRWLKAPQKALGYQPPIDAASTEEGAQEVERLIGRIEQGIFS